MLVKKRLLTFLLSFVMLAGIVSVSTVDADAATTDEILAENVTGNTYTDTTAKAEESYIYTIERSDGAVQEIVVLAEGTETGNSVQIETIVETGSTEYVLATGYTSGETYILVDEYNNALKSNGTTVSAQTVTINDGKIVGPLPELEFKINEEGSGWFTLVDNSGKYLSLKNNPATLSVDAVKVYSNELSYFGGYYKFFRLKDTYYLRLLDGEAQVTNRSSNFKLYSKTVIGSGSTEEITTYTVDTTGLDALIAECEQLLEENYTEKSWADFEKALTAAKNAKSSLAESYETEETANAALAGIDAAHNALLFAKNALEQLDPFTAEFIKWERTLEPANNSPNNTGELVVGVEYITNAEPKTDENGDTIVDTNFSVITWKEHAEEILDLTTNPDMTVWDYNTDDQYADDGDDGDDEVDNVVAATWNEHEQANTGVDGWRNASVRRFTGKFIWPEGYDVDDKIIFQSVNDSNYKEIYDYIKASPELSARYGDSRVYPINDDMFIFIRKAGDVLATENSDYLNHMLFWTGTSGKGLWSAVNDMGGGDWDRTAPATFNGISALPAYYSVMPNNNDISGTPATVDNLAIDEMKHSDGWYTMVDADTIMTTIRNLYGVENLEGQEMIIDVFCFDNSTFGGMDKFDLIFQKTPETTTSVQVNYYLDSIMADNLLGSTVMTGVADGTQITLHKGTDVNELDRFRFVAASKAGTVVSEGVQQSPDPYIVDIDVENNIINVVYTSSNANDRVYYFYDFGVENEYVYTPKKEAVLDKDYKITAVANTNENIRPSISEDGKKVILKYTPTNALGEVVVGNLNITFDGAYGTEIEPVVIAPASNVLYEENFIRQSTELGFANWMTFLNDSIQNVTDNETTVFGYTDSYALSTEHSGLHMATVNNTTPFTENLEFQFGGTGFDLIGSCGPNTGTIAVRVVNSAGACVKSYLVDTSYVDSTGLVDAGTTINQVPLLQAKDLPEDIYTVTIRGAYIVYNSRPSTYAFNRTENSGDRDTIADIYELLYGVGMTEDDIDSVEYINMGKLMGARTFALTGEDESIQTTVPEEMIIAIDGFRSYRATDYRRYPSTELGVVYQNILDCVGDGFAGYIESKKDGTYQVNEYEISGGPQNEIYLTGTNTAATGLVIGKTNNVSRQISLRSVDGKPVTVMVNGGTGQPNGETLTLSHTTEMYYEVFANTDGFIVIQVDSGFLGIGNLKLTSGNAEQPAAMPTELTEEDYEFLNTTLRLYSPLPEIMEEVNIEEVILKEAILENVDSEEVISEKVNQEDVNPEESVSQEVILEEVDSEEVMQEEAVPEEETSKEVILEKIIPDEEILKEELSKETDMSQEKEDNNGGEK